MQFERSFCPSEEKFARLPREIAILRAFLCLDFVRRVEMLRYCLFLSLGLAHALRVPAVRMGLFDGVKEAFSQPGGDKPLVAAERVTPFDRWMGLDKELVAADAVDETAAYIDPSDVANYVAVQLAKPMGIAFVENDGECGGVYVDEVLGEGSASSCATPLLKGDQLVAVGSTLVLGADFDVALDAIKADAGETTALQFFRGPTTFLYGPTAPTEEWLKGTLLK